MIQLSPDTKQQSFVQFKTIKFNKIIQNRIKIVAYKTDIIEVFTSEISL